MQRAWTTRKSLREQGRVPIFIEFIVNAVLGLAFSWCARDRVYSEGAFAAPAFHLVLGFTLVFIAPVTVYLYASHGDWSWMYWLDPQSVPALAIIPVTVGQCVAILGGWYLGCQFSRLDKKQWHSAAIAISCLFLLVLWLIAGERLAVYGTYSDFANGNTLGLMKVKLGYVLCVIALGACVAAVFLALELIRDSRRVRSRK